RFQEMSVAGDRRFTYGSSAIYKTQKIAGTTNASPKAENSTDTSANAGTWCLPNRFPTSMQMKAKHASRKAPRRSPRPMRLFRHARSPAPIGKTIAKNKKVENVKPPKGEGAG